MLLGPLSVAADDGSDLTPRGAQQRQLVAALAQASPQPVSIGALAELLWGGPPPGANSLAVLVSKTRKAVGGIDIARDGQGYRLHLGTADSTDVDEFRRLVASARLEMDAGRPRAAAGAFDAALSLVRGVPLADLDGAGDAAISAASLTAMVAAARTARCEALLATGDQAVLADLAGELEAMTAAAPLDEHLGVLLITAQYRLGRQADALSSYQRLRHTLAEQLGLEPGPELRAVEQQVLDHDPEIAGAPRRPSRRRPPLPVRLTPLIGRDALLDELDAATATTRLMTLLGPGGAGKTSLALELARRRGDGAVFVTLAGVAEPEGVPAAIAAALGVATPEQPLGPAAATALDRLVDSVAGENLLLALDNCEHVVDSAAATVHTLLQSCPNLTVLATSREALGVPGEVARQIPPLPAADAVALFVDRASTAVPGTSFGAADLERVAMICGRLDHLPLAIELAASRTSSLGLEQMLQRLDDRFALLDVGPRTADPRQRTLRAVVDWSHDLLDDAERAVFRRFAVFAGGATLEALEDVCADVVVPRPQVAAVVQRLVDKSLLVVDRHRGTHRYWMLQTLSDYADERLRQSGEAETVRSRHAAHCAAFVAPARSGLIGAEQRRWIRLLTAERENIRLAVDVAVARGDARTAIELAAPTGWYFYMVGQHEFGASLLRDALSCPGPTDNGLRALTLATYAWLMANTVAIDEGREASAEAVALLATVDDPWIAAYVTLTRIMVLFFSGRIEAVRQLVPSAVESAESATDPWIDGLLTLVHGELATFDGESEQAERQYRQAVDRFQEAGDLFGLSIALTEAAEIAEMRGDYDHAVEMLRRGLLLGEQVGFSGHPLGTRARLANVEILRGHLEAAERLHLGVLEDLQGGSVPWAQTMSCVGLASIARRRGDLAAAGSWLSRAWELSVQRDVPIMRMLVLVSQAYTAAARGDQGRALAAAHEGLDMALVNRAPRPLAYSLEAVAAALAAGRRTADHRLGARLLGHADHLRRRSGGPLGSGERFDVDLAEGRLRASLGEAEWSAQYETGAATGIETLLDAVFAAPVH